MKSISFTIAKTGIPTAIKRPKASIEGGYRFPLDARIINNTFYSPVGDLIRIDGRSNNIEVRDNVLWSETGTDIVVANDSQPAFFSDYNFKAKTWAGLNKDRSREANAKNRTEYQDTEGSGFLKRGAVRYQVLVPSYTVMFAFFLVLTVGWLFVAERRHGTLVRLRAAPLSRGQILLGKLM